MASAPARPALRPSPHARNSALLFIGNQPAPLAGARSMDRALPVKNAVSTVRTTKASGSQLGPLVSGAGQVILVIGAQKIVRDLATGLRRIYEYCYPLEDARARRAYGVPSGVNNILIINKAITPGRVTAIIVNERLGF